MQLGVMIYAALISALRNAVGKSLEKRKKKRWYNVEDESSLLHCETSSDDEGGANRVRTGNEGDWLDGVKKSDIIIRTIRID